MSSYERGIRAPSRGEESHLTREEEEFIRRYLARPESFPPEFWRAVVQKVSLDGEPIPASQIQGARSGIWKDYTPAWTSTGTQPAIGNGTLVGRFLRDKSLVHCQITMVMGSTTTYGTGGWLFTIPTELTSTQAVGVGRAVDDSAVATYGLFLSIDPVNGIIPVTTADSPGSGVSNSIPFIWASGDTLFMFATYEAA